MGDRPTPKPRVCPWWVGFLLLFPLRRCLQDPLRILGPYVREGMTVLEIGPGMGYFSLPLARMVGESGRVFCCDVESRMLEGLKKRAAKAGLLGRIAAIHAAGDSLRIEEYDGRVDFALAFAVVHEVADPAALMAQIHRAMKPGALLLVSEPTGHVSAAAFDGSVAAARTAGFTVEGPVAIKRGRSVLLRRPGGPVASGAPRP